MAAPPEFESAFAAAWPPSQWAQVHVVVAVSGGADSVALLRALTARRRMLPAGRAAGELIVAHVNHDLRAEAAADAEFVEQLARSLRCRYIGRSVDVLGEAATLGDGIEAAARQLRYRALLEIAHETGARYLATGHTADDQAETVLHRIIRGTGIHGLTGMRFARRLSDSVMLVRPLLSFRRDELEVYLAELGQGYRTDATNLDTRFTRNRIRSELLPQLARHFNPAVVEALLRLAASAAESQQALQYAAEQLAEATVVVSRAERIEIACGPLAPAPVYLRTLVISTEWSRQHWPQQAMTRDHWQRLAGMVAEEGIGSAEVDYPGGVTAQRNEAGQLVLTRLG